MFKMLEKKSIKLFRLISSTRVLAKTFLEYDFILLILLTSTIQQVVVQM